MPSSKPHPVSTESLYISSLRSISPLLKSVGDAAVLLRLVELPAGADNFTVVVRSTV